VLHVQTNNKRNLLAEVLRDRTMARVLVFTRTKHGANRVAEHLNRGGVCTEAIHGNKSQSARERALAGFKKGNVRVLVATDIASRGIDVDGITHVINFELPNEPESYVHRIGRTGARRRRRDRAVFLRSQRAHLSARHRAAHPRTSARGGEPPPTATSSMLAAQSRSVERDPARDQFTTGPGVCSSSPDSCIGSGAVFARARAPGLVPGAPSSAAWPDVDRSRPPTLVSTSSGWAYPLSARDRCP